jgi:hypothetical protein
MDTLRECLHAVWLALTETANSVQLPMTVLKHILIKPVRKVVWASYGSHSDSWFFAYELQDGSSTFQVGAGLPPSWQKFLDRITPVDDLRSSLRVQLGANDSFVAWTKTSWACDGVPAAVEVELYRLSSAHLRSDSSTRGSMKGALSQIVWHADGTYFIHAQQGYFWNFDSSVTLNAWVRLWSGRTAAPSLTELSELVVSNLPHLHSSQVNISQLFALDPHAPVAETFVLIKQQHDAHEAPFVIHFHQDTAHTAEALEPAPPVQPVQDTQLQHIEREPEKPKFFRWAISKTTGRPHPKDSWELELWRGQKIKVWEDLGKNWHIAENGLGMKGWVHGTWFAFCGSRVQKDPYSTLTRFQEDMRKLLVPGQLRDFPPLLDYMGECVNAACQPLKTTTTTQIGMCVHNLHTLLEGSGHYSYDWLKEERNVWHPDQFARYCHPSCKEQLKTHAQEVFVLYGVLMDMCEK